MLIYAPSEFAQPALEKLPVKRGTRSGGALNVE